MDAALGSIALTLATVVYLAIAYWDTKVAPPLDQDIAAARPR